MRLTNRLSPFEPQPYLRVAVRSVGEMTFVDEDTEHEFGFKPRSKQSRFFDPPHAPKRVVGMLYVAGSGVPTSMTDPAVVCRLFGTVDRDGSLELWHISVAPSHPLNDSGKGTRWGVHNVAMDTSGAKTRWRSTDGTTLTERNAQTYVRGTPNPYAVECLVRVAEYLNCPSIRQHDQMPCAKLFHKDYDHRTHPAVMLIYEALRFARAPGVGQYIWMRDTMPPLLHSYQRLVQCMFFGITVV
jgi:hypothetical protein